MSPSPFVEQVYGVVGGAAALVQTGLRREVTREVKQGPGQSHHSLMTQLDLDSQAVIVSGLSELFPDMWFLAEERCSGNQVITDNHLDRLFDPTTSVCVVDSLDGTASAARRRWDWSVCAHVVRGNAYCCGAIVAPDVRGGFHVVAEASRGAFLQEGSHRCQTKDLMPVTVSRISALREATVDHTQYRVLTINLSNPKEKEWNISYSSH